MKRFRTRAKTAYGLLSAIRRIILDDPRRYNQTSTLDIISDPEKLLSGDPPCGTIGCVAGWTVALLAPHPEDVLGILLFARRALGLSTQQEYELFDGGAAGWSSPQTASHARAGARHIAAFQEKYRQQLKAKKI